MEDQNGLTRLDRQAIREGRAIHRLRGYTPTAALKFGKKRTATRNNFRCWHPTGNVWGKKQYETS